MSELWSLPLSLLAGLVGALLARVARVPGGGLLGAVTAVAALHLAVPGMLPLPGPVRVLAQILIGAAIGSVLRPEALLRVGRLLPVALTTVALLLVAAAAIGAALTVGGGLAARTALLAVAPGGAVDVTAVALQLGEDAPVVAGVHLGRQLLVFVLLGGLARALLGAPAGGAPGGLRAAGAVLWRPASGAVGHATGTVRVALVHRPRYDDWSLPKGKLRPGEGWKEAAVREVGEETGQRVRVGAALSEIRYPLPADDGRPGSPGSREKVVRFWAMEALGGRFQPGAEVDELRWLAPEEALRLLAHDDERAVLRAFLAALPGE